MTEPPLHDSPPLDAHPRRVGQLSDTVGVLTPSDNATNDLIRIFSIIAYDILKSIGSVNLTKLSDGSKQALASVTPSCKRAREHMHCRGHVLAIFVYWPRRKKEDNRDRFPAYAWSLS